MYVNPDQYTHMPLGIVLRRTPGATRWARWEWRATGVLPGAGSADWRVLRKEGDAVEYHAATVSLELHGAEAEAYMHGLAAAIPAIYVVLRRRSDNEAGLEVLLATASPYEAQDYADSGEEVVERVPMPEGLVAWVRDFATRHFEAEEFKKRRRDRKRVDVVEDGIGDARISQIGDVYASPARKRKARLQ